MSRSRLPEFLPVSNTPPPPRLLDSPHVGINFIAATPSPAPTYMLAKPNSVPSTASTTPRGGISALPPIIVPQYTSPPSMDSSDPTGPIMFSARMDDSDADSASLYSLPSAPSSHPPSRSATSLLPIPPVPPIPAQYQSNPAANSSSSTIRPPLEKREIDFRDVGLPNPHFPAPATSPEDDEMQLDRSNTAFIGSLLQQRAERVEASSESGAGLERSMSQVSHIERAGSIRAAGEAGYGTRLAKVRETRGSEDALLVEGTGTRSTKASVHSKWAAEGALKAVSEKDGSKVEVSLSKDIPDGTLTGAFTPSAVSPEHTPPSDYPYMAGQDLFHAHTAPLNIRKP
ncbi:hypothetical protein BDQ17DRAFT_1072177 [Cyathus striatus]|nr:hypothetical protein BDQ17DRAFT_1072177 [Cyathus striatus]